MDAINPECSMQIDQAEVPGKILNETLQIDRRPESPAEHRLRQLVTLMDNLPDLVWIKDVKGRYEMVNQAYALEKGLAPEAIVGKDDFDLWPQELAAQFRGEDRSVMASGRTHIRESAYVDVNGIEGWVEIIRSPIHDQGGSFAGSVGIVRDITDRKEAEDERRRLALQLQQAQKMEAIGTLAGGIAHDFNNILAAIMNYTELALSEAPPESNIPRWLDMVMKAGHRASDLINQILTFSRQQKDQEKEPVQMAVLLKEVLDLLHAAIPDNIRVRHEIQCPGITIKADPTQIHQVLINLCTNAVHAMEDEGGDLTLRLEDLNLDPDEAGENGLAPGAYACLTVSDTGCGMDSATVRRIFEPFYTTKSKGHGTGMGLAVVDGIIKSHGGAILVDSRTGHGTAVRVWFPSHGLPKDA